MARSESGGSCESVTIDRTTDNLPIQFGVHVAIAITEVPNPPEDELKAMALKMHRQGGSYRSIAKAVGRAVGTVHKWINEAQGGRVMARLRHQLRRRGRMGDMGPVRPSR